LLKYNNNNNNNNNNHNHNHNHKGEQSNDEKSNGEESDQNDDGKILKNDDDNLQKDIEIEAEEKKFDKPIVICIFLFFC